ncbi:MAG: hypothetical protein GY950_22640 [bacterium]|nr:hypothetical protein [bacterium]
MKKEIIKRAVVLSFVLLGVLSAGFPLLSLEVPVFEQRVNDYGNVLSGSQEATLETLLRDTENNTSSQVVLMTIKSLEGEALEDYSLKVVEKNKPGQKKFDNGVLVLVSLREKKIRIEVGYGLEPIITDLKSGYIIRKLMVPYFKKSDYYGGITQGVTAVTGLITKDFDISPEQLAKFRKGGRRKKGRHIPMAVIIFIIIVLLNLFKGGTRGGRRGGGIFYGGGFGSGGGGGGGFSGGGGSFGGGGASGGW